MTKPPTLKWCPGFAGSVPVLRQAAFLGWYPGQRTEHRQLLQRDDAQTYFMPLTSAIGHFLVMIVRGTKRNTTAVPAPTETPATMSARRTPTVIPRTVAAASANATSADAGRGLLIALPFSLLVMFQVTRMPF